MLSKKDIFILCLLFLGGVLLTAAIYLPNKKAGNEVSVSVDGKVSATYSLDKNATIRLTPSTDHENVMKIKNGFVSIIEANCKDKLCVHHHSIRAKGESIVCLPHKLSVTITESDLSKPDAVTG